MQSNREQLKRWRLILGPGADPDGQVEVEGTEAGMDQTLDALYDSDRAGSLGNSSPHINRWLGDIRTYFPRSVVQMLQKDALDRLGLERMLMEPELLESLEVNVELVATLISLNQAMPEKTRDSARQVVEELVRRLLKKLENPIRQAVRGSLSRASRNYRPRFREIDWNKTILANLKHYQPEYKTVIPERLIGQGRRGQSLQEVFLLVDQSASMAGSVVYAGIAGSILASLPSLRTHLILFDTQFVDMTDRLDDPVELLFGAQLGGGTDINKALAYVQSRISSPEKTLIVLISDLFEGGHREDMLKRVGSLLREGCTVISLLALDDRGSPAFDQEMAGALGKLSIPVFACTPDRFPDLMAAAINRQDIRQWAIGEGLQPKA